MWRRHPEPSRIFFQGLIQLAAAYHQLGRKIHHGVVKHLRNARLKLAQFPRSFLGVDVPHLLDAIDDGLAAVDRLGPSGLSDFPPSLVPSIRGCVR